jgi:hypothetical protein
MSDTTSIDDLPLSSQTPSSGSTYGGGTGGGGTPLIYSPNIGNNDPTAHGPTHVPGTIMNEVLQGVQRASANGMTMIPTRDIPMNTNSFTHDDQARPNYVPPPPTTSHHGDSHDYIKDHTSMESIVRTNARQSNQLDTIEAIYYDLQMPILIGVLYFIFQMPVFRAQLLHFLPSLFGEDGNFKIMGLTATSVMFAGTFFVIMKVFNKLGEGLR